MLVENFYDFTGITRDSLLVSMGNLLFVLSEYILFVVLPISGLSKDPSYVSIFVEIITVYNSAQYSIFSKKNNR